LLALLALTLAFALGAPVAAQPAGAEVLASGGTQVIYWPGQRVLAERVLQTAAAPARFPGIPPDFRMPPPLVVLAPSPALWDSATGGALPEWSAGVAFPARNAIVLPTYRRPGAEPEPLAALRHELAHLTLHAYLGEHVPTWFQEGYATWVAGELDESAGWQIRLAFLLGKAPPLDSLSLEWPEAEGRARLAYLLSASAVRFLGERSGEPAFAAFLADWRAEGDFNRAIRSVYHMTPGQFEEQWRAMVRQRYGWLLLLSQAGVVWGVLAVLMVLLARMRRQQRRARIAELEREYYMLPPRSVVDSEHEAALGESPPEEPRDLDGPRHSG
jgi:hypothetical protein